ncbi:MAG: Multidrug resistance protein MdtA [Myxococcota bacterium]|nr:Multidrug resistance protein MdtA [Myxococcota bacterium]
MKLFKTILLWVLLAVLLAAAVRTARQLMPKETVKVRVAEVRRGEILEIVQSSSSGAVMSAQHARIRGASAGEITELYVERGMTVRTGDPILKVDARELKARFDLAQANLRAGESALRQGRERLDAAERELKRLSDLQKQGLTTPQLTERAETERNVARESLSALQANIDQLRASVELAKTTLDKAVMRAPFGGLISELTVELGETLTPGQPVYELVDPRDVYVEAPIDEVDLGRIGVGQPVIVSLDAYPELEAPGRIIEISPVISVDLKLNRTAKIRVQVNPPPGVALRVGMSADIEIVVNRKDDALFAPTVAVIGKGETREVYAIRENRTQKIRVATGLANWERTEILSGLSAGEQVIVSLNAEGLAPGKLVEIIGQDQPAERDSAATPAIHIEPPPGLVGATHASAIRP